MTRFSAFSLLANALTGNKNWTAQWPDSQPKDEYDVVIVGAGGHGLARPIIWPRNMASPMSR
jgi:sarcosine oxidase subunit beta